MRRRAPDFGAQRERMVERQLRRRGIGDERVLAAMAAVPRERFVPDAERGRAYDDSALPIGHGQTISQPWIVAAICQALRLGGSERVLDVGSGSGYSSCVLAGLAREVVGIERIAELVVAARHVVSELGIEGVRLIEGDGTLGLPEEAPFDAIAVHAAAPAPPPSLIAQLAPGGRLVVPISGAVADMLTVLVRSGAERPDAGTGAGLEREVIGPCRFVPLIGSEGFPER